jgi:hypothetical protein
MKIESDIEDTEELHGYADKAGRTSVGYKARLEMTTSEKTIQDAQFAVANAQRFVSTNKILEDEINVVGALMIREWLYKEDTNTAVLNQGCMDLQGLVKPHQRVCEIYFI